MYAGQSCGRHYGGEFVLKKLLARLKPNIRGSKANTSQKPDKLTGKLKTDEQLLRNLYKDCDDVKYKKVVVPAMGMRQALILYVEGLVDSSTLNRDIVSKLLEVKQQNEQVRHIADLLAVGESSTFTRIGEFANDILQGKVAIILDGYAEVTMIDTKNWPSRGIEEPIQERLIRGPREGFTEVIQMSLALIRRRLPDPNLKVHCREVGRRSRTKIAVAYIEDVCNLDTVEEIKERLAAIDIDGILDPGATAELITERTITPFPLFLSTERPDKVVGGLLQGKIAIIADGSPFVLLAPVTAADFFQLPEDYYMHSIYGTLARMMRFIGIILGTTATAAYTAVVSYHYEMIPQGIIVFIAETRQAVPFSPITEALLLEGAVELLREASIRLPGPIGPTLSIVGALILGQAAVDAQLVSPVLLIVVATSFLAGSSIPNYEASLAIRFLRFPLLVMAGYL
ncbi:MAG: spore germination protein [Firmicutes bacterium]|nr:spore germination protein [Bacillota bacterium]